MATNEAPNNEMTAELKKEEITPVEAAAPTTNEGIPPVSDTVTDQPQLEATGAPIPGQNQLEVPTDVDTSAMIAEAAAAAVYTVGDVQLAVDAALAADGNNSGGDAAAAVAAVAAATGGASQDVTATDLDAIDAETKKNEQRRKRYREKSVEEEVPPPSKKQGSATHSHEDQLANRRLKDRQRYASMTPDQRQIYNAKRREQYHRQSENSRQRRRERERERYHSLENEDAKKRNTRRAKLERERYQRLNPEQLEAKNRKRRERAAAARNKKAQERNVADGNAISEVSITMVPPPEVKAEGTAAVVETPIAPVAEQPLQQQVVEAAAVEAAAVAAVAAAQAEKQGDQAAAEAAAAVEAVDNHISV